MVNKIVFGLIAVLMISCSRIEIEKESQIDHLDLLKKKQEARSKY